MIFRLGPATDRVIARPRKEPRTSHPRRRAVLFLAPDYRRRRIKCQMCDDTEAVTAEMDGEISLSSGGEVMLARLLCAEKNWNTIARDRGSRIPNNLVLLHGRVKRGAFPSSTGYNEKREGEWVPVLSLRINVARGLRPWDPFLAGKPHGWFLRQSKVIQICDHAEKYLVVLFWVILGGLLRESCILHMSEQ